MYLNIRYNLFILKIELLIAKLFQIQNMNRISIRVKTKFNNVLTFETLSFKFSKPYKYLIKIILNVQNEQRNHDIQTPYLNPQFRK